MFKRYNGFISKSRLQSTQDSIKLKYVYEKIKMANVLLEILDSFSSV